MAALRAEPTEFALVISDLSMPGMDGLELGAQILKIRPGLPMILTSGFSGVLTVKGVRELGFRELLEKPTTARSLGESVHRVLTHFRAQTAPPASQVDPGL